MDKVNFCNKCQLERINTRAEASYVCMYFLSSTLLHLTPEFLPVGDAIKF